MISTLDKQATNTSPENFLFYHEDDYCQVEIVPVENFHELIVEAENVQDFAEKHQDGAGYTDMMVRAERGLKLSERGIKVPELEAVLAKLFVPRHTEITTGIRPGEFKCENTIGYGLHYTGIFFDFASDTVANIWLVGSVGVEIQILIKVLNELGQKWDLILMDWNSLELIDLKNSEQIEKYLA